MKKEMISAALGEIDAYYVEEALAHRLRKTAQLLMRIGAIAACLVVACGVVWNAAFSVRLAIRDRGKGEIVSSGILGCSNAYWRIQEYGYWTERGIEAEGETYEFAAWGDDLTFVGECLNHISAVYRGSDDKVLLYALRGVSSNIAVCAFDDNSENYKIYYNFAAENATLSFFWEATRICENVIFPSSICVYEYRTKSSAYSREYQMEDSRIADISALLREIDGEPMGEDFISLQRAIPERAVYFYCKVKNDCIKIDIEDTGYFLISTEDGYWCKTFYIGVENAVRFIDAIEALPRKQKEESTYFFDMTDATMTETASVEATTSK